MTTQPNPPSLAMLLEAFIVKLRESGVTYREGVHEFQRRWVLQELAAAKGNQVHAARQLRMHRNSLWRTMKILNIAPRYPRRTAARPANGRNEATAARDTRAGAVANSVRKGGRGESPEPAPAAAHLAKRVNTAGAVYSRDLEKHA